MSNKQAKKIRKQTRKQIKELSKGIYGQVLRKLSKQRDVFAILAFLFFAGSVVFSILYFMERI